jgi:restriction system protein
MRRDHSGDGVKDFEFRQRASQRASAKRLRQVMAWGRQQERERARAERQAQRALITAQKENIRLKQEEISRDIEAKNRELAENVASLHRILGHTLSVNDSISFDSLKVKEEYPQLTPPANLLKKKYPPAKSKFSVKPLNWFTRLIPGAPARHEKKLKTAEENYRQAVLQIEKEEAARNNELEQMRKEYEEKKQAFLKEAAAHNQEVESMKALYFQGDPDAIIRYNELVLERSEYPDDFPQEIYTAYDLEEKALRIEYKLPPLSIIPTLKELKYMKKSNELKEIQRKESEISNIYEDVIVAIALRSLHEVFEADQGSHLNVVEFEGDSELCDKATGRYLKVCVSATKEEFLKINLALIDKLACFKELGGHLTAG